MVVVVVASEVNVTQHSAGDPPSQKKEREKSLLVYSQPYSIIVQELCESRGGRPGLSVLTSLLVSVDVKLY